MLNLLVVWFTDILVFIYQGMQTELRDWLLALKENDENEVAG